MSSDVKNFQAGPAVVAVAATFADRAAAVFVAAGFVLAFFFRGYFGIQTILICIALALPLAVATISAIARFRRLSALDLPEVSASFTLLWLWMGLTLFWCPAPGSGLLVVFALSGLPLGYWAYTLALDRERVWRLLGGLLLAAVLGVDLYAFYQYAVTGVQRPASLFLDPNNLGGLNVLAGLPVLAALAEATLPDKERSLPRIAMLVLVLLLMATTAGLSGSRSAVLAAVPGVLIVAAFCSDRNAGRIQWADRRVAVAVGAVVLLAIFAWTGIGPEIPVFQRFTELARDPLGTIWLRGNIWEASLRLLREVPWYGGGLGVYWLAFPQVQNPEDASRGFNSHNDYLQLLVEGGQPAVLLLGAIIVLGGIGMARLWRSRAPRSARTLEAAGLFAGLLALWAQCLLQSNLYLLPMSLLAGLMLGRFHDVIRTADARAGGGGVFPIPAVVQLWGVLAISVALLAALLLTSFSALYYERGSRAIEHNDTRAADEAFDSARRIAPVFEAVHLAQADMLLKRILAVPAANADERNALAAKLDRILDEAERVNPLRPEIFLLRGHAQISALMLDRGRNLAAAKTAYGRALVLDPKLLDARVALAVVLARGGDPAAARNLLEQGLPYTYATGERLLQYYRLTAQARMQAGDIKGALQVSARAQAVEEKLARRR